MYLLFTYKSCAQRDYAKTRIANSHASFHPNVLQVLYFHFRYIRKFQSMASGLLICLT